MAPTGFDIVESLDQDLPAAVGNLTLDEVGLRYGDVVQAGDRYFEISAGAAEQRSDSGLRRMDRPQKTMACPTRGI